MGVSASSDISRLTSNYGRLALNLVMGLLLVPVLIHWIGTAGFGLFALIFQSIGIASTFEEITRQSMIRELASAHHSGDRGKFLRAYNSSLVISAVVAVLAAAIGAAVLACLPLLKIAPEWQAAARTMIIVETISGCIYILAAPAINMYVITFRFVTDNVWLVVRRSSYLIAALICAFVLRIDDPIHGFVVFILIANALNIATAAASLVWIVVPDGRLVPRLGLADRAGIKEILPTFGWNTATNFSMNMYDKFGGVFMNLAFGIVGSSVWGISLQLAAYVRMVSLGVNSGIDALAARISAQEANPKDALAALIRYGTPLHALVAFPAAGLIFCLTRPMLELWVGRSLKGSPDAQEVLSHAVIVAGILLIPITVRSISDCWTRILYGAGYVASYARLVMIGGVINPIVTAIGLFVLPLPDAVRETVPAVAYALVYTLFHFILVPVVGARLLHIRTGDMLRPVIRPLFAVLAVVPVMLVLVHFNTRWSILELLAAIAIFGMLYSVSAVFIGLTGSQRRRLTDLVMSRVRGARQPELSAEDRANMAAATEADRGE